MDDHVDGIDFHWYPNWQAVSDSAALATISQLGDFAASFHAWLSGTTVASQCSGLPHRVQHRPWVSQHAGLRQPIGEWTVGCQRARRVHPLLRKRGGTNLWNIMGGSLTPDTSDPSAGDLGYLQHNGNTFHYQERADYWAMQMMSSDWAIAETRGCITGRHYDVAAVTGDVRRPSTRRRFVPGRGQPDEVNAYSARIDRGAVRPRTRPPTSGPSMRVTTFGKPW